LIAKKEEWSVMSAQALIQAARKRKCGRCGKMIVKGEYILQTGKKAYGLDCAAFIFRELAWRGNLKFFGVWLIHGL
jgi:hypothetical protein